MCVFSAAENEEARSVGPKEEKKKQEVYICTFSGRDETEHD